jgi:hypothetical protein
MDISLEAFEEHRREEILTCVECYQLFSFSASERRFFEERALQPPKRCKPCRERRKVAQKQQDAREDITPH